MIKQLLTFGVLGIVLSCRFGHGADEAVELAPKTIGSFTLTDPRDQQQIAWGDFKDKKAVVVVFVGVECPINNFFMPRLTELHKEYSSKDVQFLAVNSNSQDSAEKVAGHARKNEIPFPVLKDEGNRVADLFGAKRTPEAFVIDATGTVRYQGRIDDRYGIGYQRPHPTRRDLAEALDEVLAGKTVSKPAVPVAGCLIGRAIQPKVEGALTYATHVARILQKNCQECHRPGQIGPMPLLTCDDARAWSDTIREVVQENRMPPWYADPRHGTFSNDRRLSNEEKDTIVKWIDSGCARGDDRDLPPPREFVTGWIIGKPDAVFSMKEEFDVPATAPKDGVPYKFFTVETGFKEDRWVERAEARAGAVEVVHHIVIFIVPPGRVFRPSLAIDGVLCGVAPGDTSLQLPPGTAKKIPAGSRLVFQMHYTPNGKAQKDRSSVGLIFAKNPPDREALTVPIGNPGIRIPPGDDNYEIESSFTFKQDIRIIGFMPHMHLRGKDFLFEAIYPDGKKETLLSVPAFNFNWQSSYRLAKPVPLPKGSKVHCIAHFDNSARNPNNPDPSREVFWGDQTWDEMMIGWTELAYERKPR